jgi:hypothetical protein
VTELERRKKASWLLKPMRITALKKDVICQLTIRAAAAVTTNNNNQYIQLNLS